MALVLNHLKRKRVLHRDIKPENIFVKNKHPYDEHDSFVLKLGDFGLACILEPY